MQLERWLPWIQLSQTLPDAFSRERAEGRLVGPRCHFVELMAEVSFVHICLKRHQKLA